MFSKCKQLVSAFLICKLLYNMAVEDGKVTRMRNLASIPPLLVIKCEN